MLRSRLELGSTLHIHENEKVQLRAVTSAEASYPDSTAYLDHSNLFEAIKLRDVWVFSKPHLELKISIRIESSLHDLQGSLDGILKEMKSTLITLQLWHDLQVSIVSNDEIPTTQEGIYSLNIVFVFQQKSEQFSLPKLPRMPHTLQTGSSAIDPPPGVLRISLHDISIFFSFSSTSSNNSPTASQDSIPRCNNFENLSSIFSPQRGNLAETMGFAPGPDNTCYSSIGGSQTTVRSDDDWMSLDYNSPFCSQQTSSDYHSIVISPPQTECQHVSKATYQPFITLLDSALRFMLCQTNPRTVVSNITTIIEKSGPSLPEFAPSLFTLGYDTNVFQRARFIPMISKGIAAMLDNIPRPNADIQLKCAAVSSICSDENSDINRSAKDFMRTANPKSALKTLLWRSMQHRLLTLETTRQPRSLTTHLKPKQDGASHNPTPANPLGHTSKVIPHPRRLHSLHAGPISDTEWCFTGDSDDGDALLTDEFYVDTGDCDAYLTHSFRTQHSSSVSITSHDHDNEDDLLDNLPSTGKTSLAPIPSILDDGLVNLGEKEQEDNLFTDSPYLLPLQTPPANRSSTSLTPTSTTKGTTLIPGPDSQPSSEMEILDPSSPITISEEPMPSPTLHTFDTIITAPRATNVFDAKLTRSPNPNGSGGGAGIEDVEMLLI